MGRGGRKLADFEQRQVEGGKMRVEMAIQTRRVNQTQTKPPKPSNPDPAVPLERLPVIMYIAGTNAKPASVPSA